MANFEVKVVEIDEVYEHPNADRLTIVKIGGYTCVANKHQDGSWRYSAGDLAVYIPTASVLPKWLLEKLGMWNADKDKGMLSGSRGNRVGPVKLRGVFSEGILYPVHRDEVGETFNIDINHGAKLLVSKGLDVASYLGIIKYEPVIPSHMSGEVFNAGFSPIRFDIEPIEKHESDFVEGEPIVITEKLHGTFTGISVLRNFDHQDAFKDPSGQHSVFVYSKGLGHKGLMFKDTDANIGNVYVAQWKRISDNHKFWDFVNQTFSDNSVVMIHILGETYGNGIQDLTYGATNKDFRVFSVAITTSERGVYRNVSWMQPDVIEAIFPPMGIKMVPILYRGDYSRKVVDEYRDGKTTLGGDHIREGVVIDRVSDEMINTYGSLKLKAVSPKYKLRGNGTEFA